MTVFEREKNIRVKQIDDERFEVHARLKDKFHEINTIITFDTASNSIVDAGVNMVMVPFDLCSEVCTKMKELTGLELKHGITKWIKEIVGGPRGCAHLHDLTVDSVKAMAQVKGFCLIPPELPFEEKLQKIQQVNMGICHTYNNLQRNPKYIGNRDF